MIQINKIYHESCFDTLSRLENNTIILTVTSPPYNLGKNGHKQGEYSEYKDVLSLNEYFDFIKNTIQELLRVTKYHVVFNIQENSGNFGVITHIRNHFDPFLKETFIWVKSNPQPTFNPYQVVSSFEYVFLFSKDNPHNRQFSYCNFNNLNKNEIRNSFYKPVNNDMEAREHHFRFPEWLPQYFINNFTKEGDLVYDPFMGSGTTAKMAHLLKRNWIGSEISDEYVDIANKRLAPYLAQQTLF